MANTGVTPLQIAEVPCISTGLGIVSAKEMYLPTLDSPHSRRAYSRHLDQFIALLALETIGDVQPGHLVAYRNYIMTDGRGAPTHLQCLKAVRAFLSWAATLDGHSVRVEQIEGLLKLPKVTVLNPYLTLTKAEILRLLDTAAKSGLRDYAMMLVFLGSGLRVSELTNLACKDIRQDGDGGAYIHIRAGKGKKDRLVPIEEVVVTGVQTYLAATKRRLGTNDPLFLPVDSRAGSRAAARGSAPMTTRSCARDLKRLCEEASVAKRISPHSLRHTYALACLRFSKDLFSVSKLLGHASVATTQTYVNHINILDMRSVVPGFLVGLDRETPA